MGNLIAPLDRLRRVVIGRAGIVVLIALLVVVIAGCHTNVPKRSITGEIDSMQALANGVEFDSVVDMPAAADTGVPFTVYDQATEYWDLTAEEAIHIALQNSTVLRDLGGLTVRSPDQVPTVYDPVLRETDPRFGVDAALSAFDAQLNALAVFENNDRAVNNRFLGGGANLIKQDLGNYRVELTKKAATGTDFTLRQVIDYDANNLPGNLFSSGWTAQLEGEVRHPLLQGAGVGFNRIAGPAATPGNLNGVVLARLNTDMSVIDFEQDIRDVVNQIENAYWDLYFAYRLLESRKAARDRTLQVLKQIQAKGGNLPGGVAEQEALAEAQFYAYEIEIQNVLGGRLVEGTLANNGSRGGTFRGTVGIHVAERRLRLLMGVPLADGRLIRPARDPILARIVFDWDEVVSESMRRRTELRKQQIALHRREMEVVANRNFLLPQLDMIGRYRFRGFGKDLINSDRQPGLLVPPLTSPKFDNAFQDLTTGDFQEWLLGMEMSMPVGYRAAYNAVRNAQLQLARDRAVMEEAQRVITHDLSNAVTDLYRAYEVGRASYHRRLAVQKRLKLLEERNERTGRIEPAVLLDVYRQVADADAEYFRALVDQTVAIKNVHFEKGSLLDYTSVYLVDSQ
ncbi:Outer membrane efflux protein [Novipirellula galeiformis]|uniref:Outer membrane efflux protein n=1 Tax=Novipirellula galeiformis TaxID=2528004 RepID=A0A5C6CKR4_9BACT|nr:TolC family protein [Novipirellula galeiformis]TWU23419.1 Outer membrane efflux protein [Novipirellula galeiformis]